MGSHITLWGRNSHQDSLDALRFLKAHRYGVDRLLDIDRQPPDAADLDVLRKHLGGTLRPLLDARAAGAEALTEADDEALAAAFAGQPALFKAPILDTPKGAIAGFREQQWRRFLGIAGHQRG